MLVAGQFQARSTVAACVIAKASVPRSTRSTVAVWVRARVLLTGLIFSTVAASARATEVKLWTCFSKRQAAVWLSVRASAAGRT